MRAGFATWIPVVAVAFSVTGCAMHTSKDGTHLAWIWEAPQKSSTGKSGKARRTERAARAQAARQADYERNLATCLQGTSPFLCDYDGLREGDRKRVDDAQYAVNLQRCLGENTRSLCLRDRLRGDDVLLVQEAEYKSNLSNCMTGFSTSLCRYEMLRPDDLAAVKKAEYDKNLRFCLSPYSPMCRREVLTEVDRLRIDQAQEATKSAPVTPYRPARGPDCNDDAPCAAAANGSAGSAKTVPVNGNAPVDAKP